MYVRVGNEIFAQTVYSFIKRLSWTIKLCLIQTLTSICIGINYSNNTHEIFDTNSKFCCPEEKHMLLPSRWHKHSCTLWSFSLSHHVLLVLWLLQRKHWSCGMAEFGWFPSLGLLLGVVPDLVTASSDGLLLVCESLLLVNSAWQLRWYLIVLSGNSLSVEARKISLWFRIMATQCKVVQEEISLH